MMGRMAIVALAIGLASCAGLEPAGRNASRAPRPTATAPTPAPRVAPPPAQTSAPAVTPTPAPAQTQAAPPPQRTAPVATATPAPTTPPARQQAPVAAPQVSVPTTPPPQPARAQSADDDIVVRGAVESQVPAPAGDPRSNEERRADVRAWDQCLMQVQSAFDSDPMSPQLTTPEEYCSTSLGMSDRNSVPIARQQRRR